MYFKNYDNKVMYLTYKTSEYASTLCHNAASDSIQQLYNTIYF